MSSDEALRQKAVELLDEINKKWHQQKLRKAVDEGAQGIGLMGMLDQWAREEAEEKMRKRRIQAGDPVAYDATGAYPAAQGERVAGYAMGCSARETAASAFRNAAQRLRELHEGAPAQTDDITAISELADAIAPFLNAPVAEAVPGIAMVYDGDERRLYDTIIASLLEPAGVWKAVDMAKCAEEIIKARRAFFEPTPPAPVEAQPEATPAQGAYFKFDPRTGIKVDQPVRAQEFREYHGREAWLFNPWTGSARDPGDIGTDVCGHLIAPPGTLRKGA